MKNLKRILSFFIVMGFMFVMFGFRVGVKAEEQTVTYTVTATNAVSASGKTNGTTATYSQTYGTACQATKNNSFEIVVTFLQASTIKGITLSMHSNASGGRGELSAKIDDDEPFWTIAEGQFQAQQWYGSWSSEYVDITSGSLNQSVSANSELTIHINATANSLFCQSYSIAYEAELAKNPSVSITAPTNTNLMVGNSLQLESSYDDIDNPTPDVWTSSNTSAATVSDTGLVTPVSLGTTNITRTVNGTASNAISLKIWPSNALPINIATAVEIATLAGTTAAPYKYISSGTITEVAQDGRSYTLTDATGSITVYKYNHGKAVNDTVVIQGDLMNFEGNTIEYTNIKYCYNVTFNTNGGSGSFGPYNNVVSGTKISNPGTPTKAGNTFTGWFNGNTAWDFDNDTVTGPLALTAHWASDAAQTAINNKLESINAYISLAYAYTLNKVDSPTTYTKLTSRSQIANGDSVIIVAKYEDNYYALNTTISSGTSSGTSVVVSNDTISSFDDSYCWTLIRNDDDTWKLQNGTKYLNLSASGMTYSDSSVNFNLNITNDNSYFDIKYDAKIRTPLYKGDAGFKNYATSTIGDAGFAENMFIFVKQATAKYSVRGVEFRIRCAIDEGIAELNEDYAVTFGIEVSAGGNTVKYANVSGASFQTAGGKQFVTLDLGDLLNTYYSNLDTEFTVRAYVEYQGAYFYSTNSKTYSVKGMVENYYKVQHIDSVSEMKEILENYGYTFD